MKDFETPRWIDLLIDKLAPPELAEEIRGDLFEMFVNDAREGGFIAARRRYMFRAFGFLTKSFFWKKSSTSKSPVMMNNYFKMAKRSLLANKRTTFLNIIGLVIGIASALTLMAVIRYELNFDKFHSHAHRIYRIVRVTDIDMSEHRSAGISFPVHRAIREEIPSIENIAAMEYFGGAYVDVIDQRGTSIRKFREEAGFALVEPSFFKIFDFKDTGFRWISGNPETALNDAFTIVLTRSMAKKYFGEENPVGQALKLQQKYDFKITGVIEDLPSNTDFPFTVLLSYATVRTLAGDYAYDSWFSVNDSHRVYLVLPKGATKEETEAMMAKVHESHTPKELHESRHYLLQPLSEVHHDSRYGNFKRRTISKQTITGLGIIGIFLILTACINYINLATAQAALRAKEVGIRKVLGSQQRHVMWQFLTETFVIVAIAGIVGLLVAEILLVNLNSLLDINAGAYHFMDPFFLACLFCVIVFVTLAAGFYPSFVISGFNPVTALKHKFPQRSASVNLRKVLVVAQFAITQTLVVGTFIVVSQMKYFGDVNMGFNKEGIITARIQSRDLSRLKALGDQLRAQSFVSKVSFSFTAPSGINRNRAYADIGRPEAQAMSDYVVYEIAPIDSSYLDLYDIKLLAGRNLTSYDSARNILINKTLCRSLQLGTPHEAVGKELKISDGRRLTIAGVVDDYYGNSMKERVDNVVMSADPENYRTLNVKLDVTAGASLQEAVTRVEKIWNANFPEFLFSYQFLDENIDAFYKQEAKYAKLFQLFSIIFIVIGCLGLYGLITFVVNRKSKEVAIRKVLGATMSNILLMFSSEYVKLIIISFVLAAPVAYYFVNDWLNGFANHIQLQWWYFAAPGIVVLSIALLVVTSKAVVAARANPVDKLKYE